MRLHDLVIVYTFYTTKNRFKFDYDNSNQQLKIWPQSLSKSSYKRVLTIWMYVLSTKEKLRISSDQENASLNIA